MAANKRMFSMQIIDSDDFLTMPLSTQALYFHLSMRADDDGFLNNAKTIMRMSGCNQNDYDLLVMKSFVLEFPDGICVVKHWRINNYIRKDRYTPTVYQEELSMLKIKENGAYTLSDKETVKSPVIEVTEEKAQLQGTVETDGKTGHTMPKKHKHGAYKHVLLSDDEIVNLNEKHGEEQTKKAIQFLDEYIEMKGYKVKSHYLAMQKWVFTALKEREIKEKKLKSSGGNTHFELERDAYDYDALEKYLLLPENAPKEERERLRKLAYPSTEGE